MRHQRFLSSFQGIPQLKWNKIALVRQPSPYLANGLITHIDRQEINLPLAKKQWHNYCEIFRNHGWITHEVPPIDSCPDGVFIEDTMVAYKNTIVISRPGADSRKHEIVDADNTVTSLGYNIKRIIEPGTLDGGDILKVGSTIYVGISGRTNQSGANQLSNFLTPLGAKVVCVPTSLVLHLKSAVTALPDGTVMGYPPLVDNSTVFGRFLSVKEESGAHVVLLGENRLLIADSCPQTHSQLRDMGYELVIVDISEYEKLEGCVTCLSVRLRHAPSCP